MVLLESIKVPLGEPAGDFRLDGVDGRQYSLVDFSAAKILVIVFMCNHCPYVQAIWGRLVALQKKYEDKAVQFVGINPNLNPDYPEETIAKMKEYYQRYVMNFPYLQDTDQSVARFYKAQCTPDIYVYDAERKLVYHGRLDDNWQDEAHVTRHELDEVIEDVLAGELVKSEQKPSMGCSIKWKE